MADLDLNQLMQNPEFKAAAQYERACRGRRIKQGKEMAAMKRNEQKMLDLGFAEISTGGGCTAYHKDDEQGGQWYVTAAGGAEIPRRSSEWVIVGCYDRNGEQVGTLECKFKAILDGTVKLAPLNPPKGTYESESSPVSG